MVRLRHRRREIVCHRDSPSPPRDWSGSSTEVKRDFELVPEPDNRHDEWAIAVQADGTTVGYLPRDSARDWAQPVRRIVASGFTPITAGRVWAYEADDWGNIDRRGNPVREVRSTVQLKLGDLQTSLPFNDPPTTPYTMLPRSAIVQVTKEDEHVDTLVKFVPPSGYGLVFATLHEVTTISGKTTKSTVEVRIDDERVGQLTPQMSQRFLPMIRHLADRHLLPACWADITGSAVAAEVRIDAIKANEADDDILNGPAVTIPPLVPNRPDPNDYDMPRKRKRARVHIDEARSTTRPASDTGRPAKAHPAAPEPEPAASPPLPPAGWYPDPYIPHLLRYWSGQQWTENTAPLRGEPQ